MKQHIRVDQTRTAGCIAEGTYSQPDDGRSSCLEHPPFPSPFDAEPSPDAYYGEFEPVEQVVIFPGLRDPPVSAVQYNGNEKPYWARALVLKWAELTPNEECHIYQPKVVWEGLSRISPLPPYSYREQKVGTGIRGPKGRIREVEQNRWRLITMKAKIDEGIANGYRLRRLTDTTIVPLCYCRMWRKRQYKHRP